jgi:molybdate transport system permease protein
MSFPFVVLGAREGFDSVPRRLEVVAMSLGATRLRTFSAVTLPLAARGILHGTVFAFARALGEFGATTIVAGNIPGRTETLALGIYARIESFDDRNALLLAAISATFALLLTGAANLFLRPRR